MKHKQKNARKTKGTHVHVAKPVPQPCGTLVALLQNPCQPSMEHKLHPCKTRATTRPHKKGTHVAPCNTHAIKRKKRMTPHTPYAKNVPPQTLLWTPMGKFSDSGRSYGSPIFISNNHLPMDTHDTPYVILTSYRGSLRECPLLSFVIYETTLVLL